MTKKTARCSECGEVFPLDELERCPECDELICADCMDEHLEWCMDDD